MDFIPNYPIEKLQGADYNPRKISDNNLQLLKESISRFGVVKPLILNGDLGVLTAGHQRTKAMKELGMKTCPVLRLPSITKQDEIQFNLFHNSIETNMTEVYVTGADELPFGYSIVKADRIDVGALKNAAVVTTIGKLLMKYGEWGSVVIDEQGKCIVNSDYAVAVKQLDMELLVFKMPNEQVDDFLYYINQDYGEYYYEKLGVRAYNQTYAQPHRLSDGESGKKLESNLYKHYVIPTLKKTQRLIDFGAGEFAHAKDLRKKGYQAFYYEPFYRVKGRAQFDIKAIVTMIKEIYFDVKKNGLYDVVVLDSVINSVANDDFEHCVLTTCNALMADDGVFLMQTRCKQLMENHEKLKRVRSSNGRLIEFVTKDGYSATFRQGVWTLQKFHDKESLTKLLSKYFEVVHVFDENKIYIKAICKKPRKLPKEEYERCLDIEFNTEYPNGYKHNKHKPLVELLVTLNS